MTLLLEGDYWQQSPKWDPGRNNKNNSAQKIASSVLAGTGSAIISGGIGLESQKRNQEFQEYMATNNINFQVEQMKQNGFNPALAVTSPSSTAGATVSQPQNQSLNLAKGLIVAKLKEKSNNGYK